MSRRDRLASGRSRPINNKQGLFVAFLFLVFLGLLGLVSCLAWYNSSLQPVRAPGSSEDVEGTEAVLFVVEEGSGAKTISGNLHRKGLIRSSLGFSLLVRLGEKSSQLKAGTYLISQEMSSRAILDMITAGKVADRKVTIPEGLTSKQIAAILEAKDVIESQTHFMRLIGAKGLDGQLFPDTYHISLDSGDEDVIRMMSARFREVVGGALGNNVIDSENFQSQLILASIIEREAKNPNDRPLIASVFLNRLKAGMKLESCATVQFSLGKTKKRLTFDDLREPSPYNTYINSGLPPGPICNPGLESIAAAVHPAKTEFFFFVADTKGTHVFSKSFNEHTSAIRRLRRQEQEQKQEQGGENKREQGRASQL